MIKSNILKVLILVLIVSSCNRKKEQKPQLDIDKLKAPLENAHKTLNEIEEEEIEMYIKRHSLDMNKTSTGLRYMIIQKGTGRKVKDNNTVTLKYKLNLINGKDVYSSEKDGNKKFTIGNAEVERGLEEAVLLLTVGDKAIVIIPSYLAYGLIGDDKKIPRRATLIYNLEVLELK